MKLEVNIEKKYAFMIFGAIILLAISVGVYANWEDSKTMFHSADDVKVDIGGTAYSLQDAIADGLIGGGMAFGSWVDVTSSANDGTIPASNDGIILAYTPSVYESGNNIMGYTPADSSLPKIRQIEGAIFKTSPSQGITMPVKKGDTWKIVGDVEKVYWIPLISSGGSSGDRTNLDTGLLDGDDAHNPSQDQLDLIANGCEVHLDADYGSPQWMACSQGKYVAAIEDDNIGSKNIFCCPF